MDRNMIVMPALPREIISRIKTGESLKIFNKMHLIIITASDSDIQPIDTLSVFNSTQYLLKAAKTTEELGGQSHFFFKNLDKSPLA